MKCKLTIYNLLIFLITVAKPTTAKLTTVSTGGKYILLFYVIWRQKIKEMNVIEKESSTNSIA